MLTDVNIFLSSLICCFHTLFTRKIFIVFFLFEKDTNCFLRSVIKKCPLFFLIRGRQKLFEMYFVSQFCCPNVSKMFRAQSLNTIQTKYSKIQRKFLSEVNSKIIYHSLTTIRVYLAIIV